MIVCGLFLLYANAIFNLSTVAGMRYTWFFSEPFLFLGLIAADNSQLLTDQQAKLFYVAIFTWITVKYLLFMSAVVDYITTYMGISFIYVKPKKIKGN